MSPIASWMILRKRAPGVALDRPQESTVASRLPARDRVSSPIPPQCPTIKGRRAGYLPFLLAALVGLPASADTSVPAPKMPVEKIADRMVAHSLWIGGAHALDLYTTSWALRECPTCYEANPLGADAEARIALKMAGALTAVGACYYFERRGKPDVARGIRWGMVAVTVVISGLNVKHALEGK